MEDAFKILFLVAIIGFSLVKRSLKGTGEKKRDSDGFPLPDPDNPLPENWGGGTYGGYIPEGPSESEEEPCVQEIPLPGASGQTPPKPTPFLETGEGKHPSTSKENGTRQESVTPSEYDIRSAEEARRAFVWSEILQRRYF